MHINSVNNTKFVNPRQANFKSVYPVVHWVAETNASFVPELTLEAAQKLNERIVKMLNTRATEIPLMIEKLTQKISKLTTDLDLVKTDKQKKTILKKITKHKADMAELNLAKRVQAYISRVDMEYGKNPVARGFYNRDGSYKNGIYDSVSYIATGRDAQYLNYLGKQIGVCLSRNDKVGAEIARSNYRKDGMKHVLKRAADWKFSPTEYAELHVKMEIVRDIDGEKIGYTIPEMRYFPKEGVNNPFMLSEWNKR